MKGDLAPLAACLCLALVSIRTGAQGGATFDFKDGLVPQGTQIPSKPDGTNLPNAAVGVAVLAGGCNSPCLILTSPGAGSSYGQWRITNDLAAGAAITNFTVSFQLLLGNGAGGNIGPPNAGGNGFVFHVGPTPPAQFEGSDSSWGDGLDVNFRTSAGRGHNPGVNVFYDPPGGAFQPGLGTPVAENPWQGFFQTNGAADDFAEATTVTVTLTNGALSVACGEGPAGGVVIISNLAIHGYAPISPAQMAFTATDGFVAHEDCWLDNVDLTINGNHLAPIHGTGPPQIVLQTGNVTQSEGGVATFSVAAAGPAPYSFQWRSNGAPIAGATGANWASPKTMNSGYANVSASSARWTTPPVTAAMNGTVFSAAVSNAYGTAISAGAALKVPGPFFNPPVLAGGAGNQVLSISFSDWAGGTLYWATNLAGPWTEEAPSGTNAQFTVPILQGSAQRFFRGSGGALYQVSNYTRFYAATSFWNVPLAADPPIDTNSAAMVAASLAGFASTTAFINASYGVALAYACAADRVYIIPATVYASPSCEPGGPGVPFPIPQGTVAAIGGDGHLAVIYPALDGSSFAGKELDLWQARYDPTNDSWSASTVAVNDLYGWGATCPQGGRCNGSDAAGFALLGGAVRPEEIAQGHIDHALALATPRNRTNCIVCPGTHTDGTFLAPALPEGARIQLDPAFNVEAQSWPRWVKTIAHALQTYGAFNRDTAGYISIYGVTDQNAGVPTWASVGVPEYPSLLNELPWASMRVIEITPCN